MAYVRIGHTRILKDSGSVDLIDYTIPQFNFTRRFSILIPTGEVWEGGVVNLVNGTIQTVTDDFKINVAAG